jgi:hypothetical protein
MVESKILLNKDFCFNLICSFISCCLVNIFSMHKMSYQNRKQTYPTNATAATIIPGNIKHEKNNEAIRGAPIKVLLFLIKLNLSPL